MNEIKMKFKTKHTFGSNDKSKLKLILKGDRFFATVIGLIAPK